MIVKDCVPNTIQALREARRTSRKALAQAIDRTEPTVWKYEHHQIDPPFSAAVAIAKALGVTIDALVAPACEEESDVA
jgi:transcriptional regulator with XRE-family HTH domain